MPKAGLRCLDFHLNPYAMKNLYIFLSAILFSQVLAAQQFDWGTALSGLQLNTSFFSLVASASASDGTVVVASANMRQQVYPYPYMASIGQDGVTQWALAYDSASTTADFRGVAIRNDGTIIVGGRILSGSDIDPGPGAYILNGSGYMAFLASFSAEGALLWADTLGRGVVTGLHVDEKDNLFVTGNMDGVPWYLGSTLLYPESKYNELVLIKYSPTGQLIWARQSKGSSLGNIFSDIYPLHLKMDTMGHIYLSGIYQSNGHVIQLGDAMYPVNIEPGADEFNVFLAQYDAISGAANWVRRIFGPMGAGVGAIAALASGKIAVGGVFSDTTIIDNPTGNDKVLLSDNTLDMYLAVFNSEGSLEWAHDLGAPGISDRLQALAWSPAGEIWIGGTTGGEIDFDPGPAEVNYPAGGFLARYDAQGTFHWVHRLVVSNRYFLKPHKEDGMILSARALPAGSDFDLTPRQQIIGDNENRVVLVRYSDCDIRYGEADATLCAGEFLEFDGQLIDAAGTYVGVLASVAGCDSVLTIHVDLVAVDTSVTAHEGSLQAHAGESAFQWLDCATGLPVEGATDALFVPEQSGSYAVVVTTRGCADTSACFAVTVVSNRIPEGSGDWKLWPVPAEGTLYLALPEMVRDPLLLVLYAMDGRPVWSARYLHVSDRITLELPTLPPGPYILKGLSGTRQWQGSIILAR